MSLVTDLVQSALEFPGMIAEVALQSPITAILVTFGALFIGVAALVFGVLAVAAVGKALIPSRSPTPQQPAE